MKTMFVAACIALAGPICCSAPAALARSTHWNAAVPGAHTVGWPAALCIVAAGAGITLVLHWHRRRRKRRDAAAPTACDCKASCSIERDCAPK